MEHINVHEGKETWYQTRAKATFENGRAIKITGIVENIDKRKSLELEVQKAQKQVYDAINNIEGGIILWDSDDRVILINSYMEKLFGEKLSEGEYTTGRFSQIIFIEKGLLQLDGQDPEAWIEERIEARNKSLVLKSRLCHQLEMGAHLKCRAGGSLIKLLYKYLQM